MSWRLPVPAGGLHISRNTEEGKRALGPKTVSLRCVKSHVRIKDHEEANKRGKLSADKEDPAFPVIMEGGLKEI